MAAMGSVMTYGILESETAADVTSRDTAQTPG